MSLSYQLRSFLSSTFLLLTVLVLAGCSDTPASPNITGPSSAPSLAGTYGQYSGRVSQGSHTNLLDGEDDAFVGSEPMSGVIVRLVDRYGRIRARDTTDEWGQFSMTAPANRYIAELKLSDGKVYPLEVSIDRDGRLVMLAKFAYLGRVRALNAKLFPDANNDGISDSGYVIVILGRLAGDLTSGVVLVLKDVVDLLGLPLDLPDDPLSPLLPLLGGDRESGEAGGGSSKR